MLDLDFKQERAQIEVVKAATQKELAETEPGTPHPTCDCGRSLDEHLVEDIAACDALLAMMNSDFSLIDGKISQYGRNYMFYACRVANKQIQNPFEHRTEVEFWLEKISQLMDNRFVN